MSATTAQVTLTDEQRIALEDWLRAPFKMRAGVYSAIYRGGDTNPAHHVAVVLLEVLAAKPDDLVEVVSREGWCSMKPVSSMKFGEVQSMLRDCGLEAGEARSVAQSHDVRSRKRRGKKSVRAEQIAGGEK